MKTVFICSPYRGDVERNVKLAQDLCREAIRQGFAPFAPHLLYPQMLDDSNELERETGISAGLEFLSRCDEVWVCDAHGLSRGMSLEVGHALEVGKPVRIVPRP